MVAALLVVAHVLAAIVLILVVLLQSGKAGDLASAFGGATSQTAFGARSATTILTKATTFCAAVFMLTSLSLSILYSSRTSSSVIDELPAAEQAAPETSVPQAPTGVGVTESQESAPAEEAPAAEPETEETAPTSENN